MTLVVDTNANELLSNVRVYMPTHRSRRNNNAKHNSKEDGKENEDNWDKKEKEEATEEKEEIRTNIK